MHGPLEHCFKLQLNSPIEVRSRRCVVSLDGGGQRDGATMKKEVSAFDIFDEIFSGNRYRMEHERVVDMNEAL